MWFEKLTGFCETTPEDVRRQLSLIDGRLVSSANGHSWDPGKLEIVSLADLRSRVESGNRQPNKTSEIVADVHTLHSEPTNSGATFQVASQFNLLEMTGPNITPEQGVGIYQFDHTQGPACAIACGAGTIYRNYFTPVRGQTGQTENNQIDCLEELGLLLGNNHGKLWKMRNGYALASENGLRSINDKLSQASKHELDKMRGRLQVGIQWNTQVTLPCGSKDNTTDCIQRVSQVYCSALPVAYSPLPADLWEPFARLVLDAAYEATVLAAVENLAKSGSHLLYLTLLGGGAFGNRTVWITEAIKRAFLLHENSGLDTRIVSYGSSNPGIQQLLS